MNRNIFAGQRKRDGGEWDAAKKKRNKILGILAAVFVVAAVLVVTLVIIPGNNYRNAVALQQAGKYEEAVTAFEALNGYGDSVTQITETRYLQGKSLTNGGEYAKAADIFMSIRGYRDVDSLIANDENLAAAAARDAKYAVGNYVTFGTYPQTASGEDNTPIEWLVLARDGQKALLISRYGLDVQPYNKKYEDVTWEGCTLRKWLNTTFLNKAFSSAEQAGILLTEVDNSDSQGYSGWSTSGGNNTRDRIFLLSCTEANRYFAVTYDDNNNTKSRISPTTFALKSGAWASDDMKTADGHAAGWWWLRSPGGLQNRAAYVFLAGSLLSYYVNSSDACVRPALWINLESGIF